MEESRNVFSVLADVQHLVACPKGKFNNFGGYSYRSLEDINAALKPICEELRCGYVFTDSIAPVVIGKDPSDSELKSVDRFRWYLKSTVTFWADGCTDTVKCDAFAREPLAKKGMDEAQVTGLASSYARKYAACAMFAIDSGEDPDQMDNREPNKAPNSVRDTKVPKEAKKADKSDSTPASDQELMDVASLIAEYSGMCGRDTHEVMEALLKSKAIQRSGYDEPPTSEQACVASQVLGTWIRKTKERTQ